MIVSAQELPRRVRPKFETEALRCKLLIGHEWRRETPSSGICLWSAHANAFRGHSPWYSQWRCDAISAPDAKALHS